MASLTRREELVMNGAVLLTSWLLRFWFGSVRFNILNREVYDTFLAGPPRKDNAVVATWHRHVIPIYFFFHSLGDLLIMGSQSRDAEFAIRLGKGCRIRHPSRQTFRASVHKRVLFPGGR